MAKSVVCALVLFNFVNAFFLSSCESSVTATRSVKASITVDTLVEGEPEVFDIEPEIQEQEDQDKVRKLLRRSYRSQIGVREATGKNDGKAVAKYLRSVNLGEGYAWCAAYVRWNFDQVNVKTTITAWSPTAENKRNIVYKNGVFRKDAKYGDVITLYYPKKGRIGHTGFFDSFESETLISTVEGNTNDRKSNEGDGVYVVFRPIGTIHSISSWIE